MLRKSCLAIHITFLSYAQKLLFVRFFPQPFSKLVIAIVVEPAIVDGSESSLGAQVRPARGDYLKVNGMSREGQKRVVRLSETSRERSDSVVLQDTSVRESEKN